MKKIISLFLLSIVCGSVFVACSDSKTYAEMLEDEQNAISQYIRDNKIQVITASQFEANGNVTDLDKNEYVQLSNGVYMQIVDKGKVDADSIKNRDVVTVRFVEYDIMEKDTTNGNINAPLMLDVFDYSITGTYASGQFRQGAMAEYVSYYGNGSLQVPEGWITPLRFIRDKAHVKLIVPSKVGHSNAMQYVTPYYYDFTRIQLY